MERITKRHVAVAIDTMVTVNFGGETNIPVTVMHKHKKAKLLVNTVPYRVKGELRRLLASVGRVYYWPQSGWCDCTPRVKFDIYDCLVCFLRLKYPQDYVINVVVQLILLCDIYVHITFDKSPLPLTDRATQ